MKAWSKPLLGFIEQASYSGGRFLFWVLAPILVSDSWEQIALLSLMNLLTMSLYGGVIGGPTFIRLVSASTEDKLAAYAPAHAVIVLLSLVGPAAYLAFSRADALAQPALLFLLFAVPWVSSAADWSRKTMILLGREAEQIWRNLVFGGLWLTWSITTAVEITPRDLLTLAFAFSILTGLVYSPVWGIGRNLRPITLSALAPFSEWRSYLFTGVLAYAFGNALFWLNSDSTKLSQFVVLRNYLAPVLLLSLYIENHGALQMRTSTRRRRLVGIYVAGVALITIVLAWFAQVLLSTGQAGPNDVDPVTFAFVIATTLLIAIIKIPTVALRLRGQEYVVVVPYLFILPLWPAAYVFDLLTRLPYDGLEVLLIQYVFLLLGLSVRAVMAERRSQD